MRIGPVDLDAEILLVAEIGNNHEGRFDVAQELVRRARECGVRAVKFQTFRTDHYVSRSDAARHARLKSFELTFDQFGALADLARSLGMLFLSTPFDVESAAFLCGIVDGVKIASGDNNFFPLIARALSGEKPVLVSTGASDEAHVDRTVAFVRDRLGEAFADRFALLHCVSAYPVPPEQANLLAIPALARRHGCTVGYSDHAAGFDASVYAAVLGARLIEKHFTLDHHFSDFRDHQLSADPSEMKVLVQRLAEIPAWLGTGRKGIQPSEEGSAAAIRRSIVAGRDLKKGEKIAVSDLTWIRPAGGLAPGDEALLTGRALRRDVAFGERLSVDDVER